MRPVDLLLPHLRANRGVIAAGVCCLVVVDLLQLFIPRVLKWAVDDLAAGRATTDALGVYAGQILALAAGIGVFRYVWRRCLIGTSRRVEEDLRRRLFEHLQRLEAAYFDRHPTGDLMAHATNDVNHVRMATGMGMVALTDAIVLGAAAIGFMLYIDPLLTLLVLVPMPMIVIGTRLFSRQMHRRYRQVQAAFSDLTESVREQLSGIRVVKAYTQESAAGDRVADRSRSYVEGNLSLVRITGAFFPMMVLFSNLSLALVLLLGGRAAVAGTITAGDFVAFISYIGLITWPMMALGWVMNLIQRGKASLERIAAILDTAPTIADRPGSRPLDAPPRRIALRSAGLDYGAGRRGLAAVSIDFERGRSYGVVGPPGGGKTTLVRLLARIYETTEGTVEIDGRAIRDVPLEDLRRRIAYVPQEPFLFAGTLFDNITMGDAPAPERLAAVLADAGLAEMVERLPEGLDTVVGERGIRLSGGQKQRVGLARALLSDRPVLLLDDPVSQLDADTADRVVASLRRRAEGRLAVIVSHRLSAVAWTDEIVVLEDGRLTARGAPAALAAASAYYRRARRLQDIAEERHAD